MAAGAYDDAAMERRWAQLLGEQDEWLARGPPPRQRDNSPPGGFGSTTATGAAVRTPSGSEWLRRGTSQHAAPRDAPKQFVAAPPARVTTPPRPTAFLSDALSPGWRCSAPGSPTFSLVSDPRARNL